MFSNKTDSIVILKIIYSNKPIKLIILPFLPYFSIAQKCLDSIMKLFRNLNKFTLPLIQDQFARSISSNLFGNLTFLNI